MGGQGSLGGLAVAGLQLSPRPSDASPTARRLPRTASPVTGRLRSPPYPAAAPASTTAKPSPSRRSPDVAKMSRRRGRNAAHCPGRPLRPQRCFAFRCAGTRLRRAIDPGDLCRPSGPDGKGQARGQARQPRGEPVVSAAAIVSRDYYALPLYAPWFSDSVGLRVTERTRPVRCDQRMRASSSPYDLHAIHTRST